MHRFDEQSERKFYYVSILQKVHVYKAFESFGELALIKNKRRAAKLEVNGTSEAHFAILSKKDYRLAYNKVQNEILQGKVEFLKQFQIFQSLTDHALSQLTYQTNEHHCQRGQEIFREGVDVATKVYFVRRGEFMSYKKVVNLDVIEDYETKNDIGKFLKDGKLGQGAESQAFAKQDGPFSIKKFKWQQNISKYQVKNIPRYTNVDICIHAERDMFGY